jgi:hypothetical protein
MLPLLQLATALANATIVSTHGPWSRAIGYRFMDAADEDAWLKVVEWINQFDGLIDQNNPKDLQLFVSDDSAPDVMEARDEP